MDLRGHGDSDWSSEGAYALDHRVSDVRAIMKALDIGKVPFALVGASLGGATAIHAAARGLAPEALVVVDIVPHPEPQGIRRILDFMRAHPEGFDSLEAAADAVGAYNPERPRPKDPSGLRRNLRHGRDGRLRWHWDPRIMAEPASTHHDVVQQSARALRKRPDLPVLLVRGLQSDVVSDEGVALFRQLVPQLQVAEVSGAGHMVAGDRNGAFSASLATFLEEHLRPETYCH